MVLVKLVLIACRTLASNTMTMARPGSNMTDEEKGYKLHVGDQIGGAAILGRVLEAVGSDKLPTWAVIVR